MQNQHHIKYYYRLKPMLKMIGQTFILNRLHVIVSAPIIMWSWSEFLKMHFRQIDYLIITLAVACICQWNRLTLYTYLKLHGRATELPWSDFNR